MIMAFHTTCLVPHRFSGYFEAYAREGWAIERAVAGDCAGSYFVEIGTQQRIIQMCRTPMSRNGLSGTPNSQDMRRGRRFAPRKRN